MENTRIEWCDSTWNPVTGCYHGCEYCYAMRIANRFGSFDTIDGTNIKVLNTGSTLNCVEVKNKAGNPYPAKFTPTLHKYRLNEYERKKGRNIFVCSMADLFGVWVPDSWIEEVLLACKKAPQHNYLFLTKSPQRYADLDWVDKLPAKENMWYGTSITNAKQMEKAADAFGELPGKVKTFFSIEPMLEDIATSAGWTFANNGSYANWIILGAETGHRKEKVMPKREWIEKIMEDCDDGGIPLFMKDSLIPIIGEDNMRREFPEELRRKKSENIRIK